MTYKELGTLLGALMTISLVAWAVGYYDLSKPAYDAAVVGLFTTLAVGFFAAFFMNTLRPLFASTFPIAGIGFIITMIHPDALHIITVLIFVACLIIFTAGLAYTTSLDAKKVSLMAVGGTGILMIAFCALLLGHTSYGLGIGAIGVLMTYILGHSLDRHGPDKTGY